MWDKKNTNIYKQYIERMVLQCITNRMVNLMSFLHKNSGICILFKKENGKKSDSKK